MKSLKALRNIDLTSRRNRYFIPVFLIAFWLVMQVFFLIHNGIVTQLEAEKYINEAGIFLETGRYSNINFLFYSVQILLIAFCLKFHIHFIAIVIFQILVNGLSVFCFFKLVKKLTGKLLLAYAATFYFLIFFYYYLFNTFLFTESLFYSFSLIYTWFLFSIRKVTVKNGILILLFLALLYLTRPTGVFFIPATYFFLIIKFSPARLSGKIIIASVLLGAGLFLLVNYALASGGRFDFLLPYQKGMVICGVPTIAGSNNVSIPLEKNSIQGLTYIATHYPGLFFSLAAKRLMAFFGIWRPYYALYHNIFVSAYFYSLYLVILFYIRKLFLKNRAEIWFLLTNIALMATTVMLSCDEWSNRFIFWVMPFFILLAVMAICQRKRSPVHKKSISR